MEAGSIIGDYAADASVVSSLARRERHVTALALLKSHYPNGTADNDKDSAGGVQETRGRKSRREWRFGSSRRARSGQRGGRRGSGEDQGRGQSLARGRGWGRGQHIRRSGAR